MQNTIQKSQHTYLSVPNLFCYGANFGLVATLAAAFLGSYGTALQSGQGIMLGFALFFSLRMVALLLDHKLSPNMIFYLGSLLIISLLIFSACLDIQPLLRILCMTTTLSLVVINLVKFADDMEHPH